MMQPPTSASLQWIKLNEFYHIFLTRVCLGAKGANLVQ